MLCYERLHFLQQNHTKNGCSAHKQRWSPIPRFNRCVPTCTTHSFITLLRPPLLLQQRTYQNAIASPNWTCVPLESFICNNRRIPAFNALQIRFANLICILAQLKFIHFLPRIFLFSFRTPSFSSFTNTKNAQPDPYGKNSNDETL